MAQWLLLGHGGARFQCSRWVRIIHYWMPDQQPDKRGFKKIWKPFHVGEQNIEITGNHSFLFSEKRKRVNATSLPQMLQTLPTTSWKERAWTQRDEVRIFLQESPAAQVCKSHVFFHACKSKVCGNNSTNNILQFLHSLHHCAKPGSSCWSGASKLWQLVTPLHESGMHPIRWFGCDLQRNSHLHLLLWMNFISIICTCVFLVLGRCCKSNSVDLCAYWLFHMNTRNANFLCVRMRAHTLPQPKQPQQARMLPAGICILQCVWSSCSG